MLKIEMIPEWLRENGHFVLRRGKIPYTQHGRKANPTDPADGCTAEEALAAWRNAPDRYDGIGVMIVPPLVGIDLDHVISTEGDLAPVARNVLDMVSTYTEKSPSGTGLHLLGLAPGMRIDNHQYLTKNNNSGLEVYFGNRYFTFTGERLANDAIREIGDGVQEVLDTYMRRSTTSTESGGSAADTEVLDTRTEDEVALDAVTVIDRMKHGKDWPTIEAQLAGEDFSGDTSSDDQSLMNRLAFYSCRDTRVMDYIYRMSDRYREKWDELRGGLTYGELTIRRAVQDCRTVWSPSYSSTATELPEIEDNGVSTEEMLGWLTDRDVRIHGRYTMDDRGGGYLLADCLKEKVRYVPESKAWYIYWDGVWSKDVGGKTIEEYARRFSKALANYAAGLDDEGQRGAWMKFAGTWCRFGTRQTYIREAESVWPIRLAAFDQNRVLLNCQNGTLDLETMEFRNHSAEDLLTRKAAVEYRLGIRCERWERFMEEVLPDDPASQKFLQAWIGYCLTGMTTEECAVILYGRTSRNGKSTLCETLATMLGDYAANTNPDTLSEGKRHDGSGPSSDVARLRGIRWVQVPEPPQQMVLDAAKLKTMTGGDTITARFLHENDFQFKPEFKLTINTNYLPRVDDLTLFKSGRLHVIPFERHFSKEEQDHKLKATLTAAESLSGILNWALDGLTAFNKEGLHLSTKMEKALRDYQRSSDKLGRFIEECLPEHDEPTYKTRISGVYADYVAWCKSNGVCAESQNRWREGLRDRGIEVKRGRPSNGGNPTDVIVGREHRPAGLADLCS